MNGSFVWCLGVALTFASACIVDHDDPCGPRQVETQGDYAGCVCARGYVWSSDGTRCVRCGENQVARNGECVCEQGFARPSSSAACAPITDGATEDASESTDASGPPENTGEGTSCSGASDCEGLDASVCQTLAAPNICLIQGCATGERVCSASSVCCSFADFAPLAGTNGLCVPEGNCIGPGKPVSP